jgi:hypothetical protein
MLRRWWTWVVLGAVIAVGVFAGLDAFRSSDGKETGDGRGGKPPPCARREISLTIETRRPDPNQPKLVGLYEGLPLPEYPRRDRRPPRRRGQILLPGTLRLSPDDQGSDGPSARELVAASAFMARGQLHAWL